MVCRLGFIPVVDGGEIGVQIVPLLADTGARILPDDITHEPKRLTSFWVNFGLETHAILAGGLWINGGRQKDGAARSELLSE